MDRRRRSARALLAGLLIAAALACGKSGPATARSVFAAADSLRIEGRSAQAAPLFRSLRDSLAAAGDTAGEWKGELWWADAVLRLGERDSAAAGFRRALALAGADPDRQGWVHHERSIYFDRAGQFDSAMAEAERAQGLARRAHDGPLEANTFNAMGRINSLQGRYREALEANRRAYELKRALGGDTSRAVATELNELGIDYLHLGRFSDAVDVYRRALALERAHHNPEGQARVLSNLSNVYFATGDLTQTLALRTRSLRLADSVGLVRGEAYLHSDLGELYTRIGRYDDARAHLTRALELNGRAGLAYGLVMALGNLGRLDLDERKLDDAARHLHAALRLADSLDFGRQRASARTSLAQLALARHRAGDALRWARAAVAFSDSLGDPDAQTEAREVLGAAREAAGDADGALKTYMQVIDLLESWRGRLALGDLRMGVAEPRLAAYEGAIRVLVHKGNAAAAFDVSERARARLLLELMADRGDKHVRTGLDAVRQRLRELYEGSLQAGPDATRNAEIARLIARLAEADSAAALGRGGVGSPHPATSDEVRARLLTGRRELLAFFWGDRDVYGWWLGRDGVRAARLGDPDSLGALVEFTRAMVEDPSTGDAWRAPAVRAYRAFIAPLLPDSGGEAGSGAPGEVLVVADGPLAYLPLEVLLPRADGPPLGAERPVVYGPSAAVLLDLLQPRPTPAGQRAMLAVGDPSDRGALDELLGGQRADSLAPLPFARAEARAVARLFRDKGSDVLVGRDATEARWLQLRPGRYRFLHFAAHARISDAHPDRSRLILAGTSLDLPAIRQLDLSAELVTLSACETALGPRVRGEGVIGLPYAFLAAGAGGAVVTLWRIDDRSAEGMMTGFYQELHAGVSPAAALLHVRRRRLALGGTAAHPSHWAAFVLVGGLAAERDSARGRLSRTEANWP